MKFYAVIDTNILVSAMLNMDSIPGTVVVEALIGDIIPILNDEILKEYKEVLSREKFCFDPKQVNVLLEDMIKRGISADADVITEDMPDLKDIVFYSVVLGARKVSETYLITGNLKHFPTKNFIVTPREMLEIMDKA